MLLESSHASISTKAFNNDETHGLHNEFELSNESTEKFNSLHGGVGSNLTIGKFKNKYGYYYNIMYDILLLVKNRVV